ncbi:MAG: hypothetical protein IT444_13310 [Phycisphaeraceae bacterium]|nr:hypothetical protein [Phycisphaeraceae bacterium]
MQIGLFVIIAAVVIVAAIFSSIQARKRREALVKWAADNGLAFSVGNDYTFDERFGQFAILRQGDQRYAYNIASGVYRGREICGFDYHYQTYSTDSKGRRTTHHHYFSAVLLDCGLPMRPMLIRPEGFFDKVTEFFGYDDIDFESAAFSKAFYVKCEDKKWAFDVIQQSTMEFLLASPRLTLEMNNRLIIASNGSRLFDPAQFEAAIQIIEGVLDRLPGYLLRELKSASSPSDNSST